MCEGVKVTLRCKCGLTGLECLRTLDKCTYFKVGRTMPRTMELKLVNEAKRKFPGDKERQNKYVYGTLRKLGWKPQREK